jgi:hypothetical protein
MMWGTMNLILLLKALAAVSGQNMDGEKNCDLASDCSDRRSEDSQMTCDFKNCTFFSRYPAVYNRTFPTWMFMGCE